MANQLWCEHFGQGFLSQAVRAAPDGRRARRQHLPGDGPVQPHLQEEAPVVARDRPVLTQRRSTRARNDSDPASESCVAGQRRDRG